MTMKAVSLERANTLLRYCPETGVLTWKARDRSDFQRDRLWATWNNRWAGCEAGRIDAWGYRIVSIDGVDFRAHRVAWLMFFGNMPRGEIDHINGVRTDNRIENLRDVDRSINLKNASRRRTNLSGATGVNWDGSRQKWSARLNSDREAVFLGRFVSFEDAVAARQSANPSYGFHENHGRSA